MRDETDLNGLKLTIDLKRGADPDKLMQKLFKTTTLQDAFGCNFNILIAGMPRVMGVREIIEEWTAWRTECVRRRLFFQMHKKSDKLHLLKGLRQILLDIDKAIRIIRETETGGGGRAEPDDRLRHRRGAGGVRGGDQAAQHQQGIHSAPHAGGRRRWPPRSPSWKRRSAVKSASAAHRAGAGAGCAKYGKAPHVTWRTRRSSTRSRRTRRPRLSRDVFVSREGYFKKITPQSLRMSGEQRFKEGDGLRFSCETTNAAELLVFSDRCQVYKARCADFDDGKASLLGDYLPTKLGFDEGESVAAVCLPGDYSGSMLFLFANGKAARVELSAYQTKSNRRKLTGAYSDRSELRGIFLLQEDVQLVLYSTEGRALILQTAQLAPKTTRTTLGVAVLTLRRKAELSRACPLAESGIVNESRYRTRTLPAAGALLREEDAAEKQLSLEEL